MNVELVGIIEVTQEQKKANINYHTGEISKLSIQLLDPNQVNKDILRNSLFYHREELNKYTRLK